MEVWKQKMIIKDEQTCELELIDKTGNSEIKRKVIIKNGRVIEKPKDVDIIGENTPFGFEIAGLKLKRKRPINKITVTR